MEDTLLRTVSDTLWQRLATRLEVPEPALRAVAEVESAGSGFLPAPDRRPKVLFEGHIFHRLTAGRYSASHPALSYPRWDRRKYAGSLAGEWKRLDRAASLDPVAAMQSASWGAFQIMGFNYALCGFDSVGRFVECQSAGAEAQLEAFANLLSRPGSPLLLPLRKLEWPRFAALYNGPEHARNQYAEKMAAAYARHAAVATAGATRPRRASGARAARSLVAPGRPQPAALEMLETRASGTRRKAQPRIFNVRPDSVDLRDWEYQPPVTVAPRDLRYPADVRPIQDQGQTSACTGYALAVVIEYLLVRAGRHVEPVSPHMLYSMARRYDEWTDDEGEEDEDTGSSLRGALKGWLRHGAASARLWPRPAMPEPAREAADDWWTDAIKRPLGAYYRIDPRSLRDMHVAIDQVGALYASAFTHAGWEDLLGDTEVPRPEDARELPVIRRLRGNPDGGHAFAIVGYTPDGFIVHNSWGPAWGKGGLAVLRYSDWLENAMDCWVAQLGVVTAEHEAIAEATSLRTDARGRSPVVSSNPILAAHELSPFIINMENNGRLSQRGQFRTQPSDLDALLRIHLAEACRKWALKPTQSVDIAIYAHGGLNDEAAAAESARLWVPALYSQRIFPVFLMWETGALKTFSNILEDKLGADQTRAAGPMEKLKEWWNQRVEGIARPLGRPLWREMKENAKRISTNPQSGVRQLLDIYRNKAKDYGLPKLRVHLVGHSAGAILHSHLGPTLAGQGLDLRSVSLIAPAVRVDTFDQTLGKLVQRTGTKVLIAHLSDAAERADPTCKPYGHSLLYLVSRAFEDRRETPILGLERDLVPARATLPWGAQTLTISSPSPELARLPSASALETCNRSPEATTHGSLDDDLAVRQLVFDLIHKA
jgi:hypothetical protein